jgi:protein-S-isoprenylcysteine O-methyltransferase Ste14
MYLGLLLVVLGWAAFLCSAVALVGPVIFVAYIGRFQIAPEERVLSAKFGTAYSGYLARVRRWL